MLTSLVQEPHGRRVGRNNFNVREFKVEKNNEDVRKNKKTMKRTVTVNNHLLNNRFTFNYNSSKWILGWWTNFTLQHGLSEKRDWQYIAEGVYGMAIKIVSRPMSNFLMSIHPKYNVIGQEVPVGEYLVKIQPLYDQDAERECLREDKMLRTVYTTKTTLGGITLFGSDVVPKPFTAWTAYLTRRGQRVKFRFSLQSMVQGGTLTNVLKKTGFTKTLSMKAFIELEMKLVTLWCLGFSHMDLHGGNIILQGGNPIIIDLGFAVRMPEQTRKRLVQAILQEGTMCNRFSTIFNKIYKPEAKIQVMKTKDYVGRTNVFFNPDSVILKKLEKTYDPVKLNVARKNRWQRAVLNNKVVPMNINTSPVSWKIPTKTSRSSVHNSLPPANAMNIDGNYTTISPKY
jgi:hypothetical protein